MRMMTLRLPISFVLFAALLRPATANEFTPIASSSGTVIVINVEANRIILAADSRATTDDGYDNNDCKLLTFSKNTIFTSSGHVHLSVGPAKGETWDGRVVARRLIAEPRKTKVTSAKDEATRLAEAWGATVVSFLQPMLRRGGRDAIASLMVHGVIVEGLFAVRADAGDVAASVVTVSLDNDIVKVLHTLPLGFSVMGYSTVVAEYIPAPKTVSAAELLSKWVESVKGQSAAERAVSLTAQLTQWTIDYGETPQIGGAVDEVWLDTNGVHWVLRKSACLADSRAQDFRVGFERK
jgi:hypothetical protein